MGALLVLLGFIGIVNAYTTFAWWNLFLFIAMKIRFVLVPFIVVALVVLVAWELHEGRLKKWFRASGAGKVRLSKTDRRIFGLCGGIAQAKEMDAMALRLVVVLLFFLFPLFMIGAYFVVSFVVLFR